MQEFYSNGKLLISAEYLVLDGAIALALPTKFGQNLKVKENNSNIITWKAFNELDECWFEAEFSNDNLSCIKSTATYGDKDKLVNTLQEILNTAKILNPNFLSNTKGLEVSTTLTFPNKWGLGTSSTLINSIATWANMNAFELLEKSFGGSGYDIACAQNNTPITYKRNRITPEVKEVEFNPSYKDQLFFVYLNQKQDSKEGITMYRSLNIDKTKVVNEFNELTAAIINATTINEFSDLLTLHETKLGTLLGVTPVKEKLFSDYTGAVKSLGAWGGDFVLVTGSKEEVESYFLAKKYDTILSYNEMILQ
ncbi:GYDIA family GHMP kinase [Flavobacteriaceae bacterium]|nr:GYDIA family GHMP kinase [Flavobacteriaceae bacterium]